MDTKATPRAYTFSLLTAAAFALQAAGGYFIPGLYRDLPWVASVLRGTDFVALVVVLPLLIVSHLFARRGSLRWRLVWIGILYKIFYNNLYLLAGAHFNRSFLLYVAVGVFSAFAVVSALIETDTAAIGLPGIPCGHRKSAAALLLANAGILVVMWVGQSLKYVVTGVLPQLVVDGGGGSHLIASLDLTAIVPPLVLGAYWLWKASPWGTVVAAAMNVQCALITVDLIITPAFQAAAGVADAWAMVPLWVLMSAGFVVGATLVLRRVASVDGERAPSLVTRCS